MTSEVVRSLATASEVVSDGVIRGVASTVGNVDRVHRAFLPGAFGDTPFRVPCLAYHDDTKPLGSSLMTPRGNELIHETKLADLPQSKDFRELIKAGAIPATSIGWVSNLDYYGWRALEKADPLLARKAQAAGVPQLEGVTYFASVEIVENSLVPIPANPRALLAVASLMQKDSTDRYIVDGLLELAQTQGANEAEKAEAIQKADNIEKAAGSRHSMADQTAIQTAHDALTAAGARCSLAEGANEPNEAEPSTEANDEGITGGWYDHMVDRSHLTQEEQEAFDVLVASVKPKYAMPDGSFPINDAVGVSAAAKLAHHSKAYGFAEVKKHVMAAKAGLDCPDDAIPDSWKAGQSDLPVDAELAALERQVAELAASTN